MWQSLSAKQMSLITYGCGHAFDLLIVFGRNQFESLPSKKGHQKVVLNYVFYMLYNVVSKTASSMVSFYTQCLLTSVLGCL